MVVVIVVAIMVGYVVLLWMIPKGMNANDLLTFVISLLIDDAYAHHLANEFVLITYLCAVL